MITNELLSLHEEGRHLIQKHFDVFRNLVAQARDFAERGEYDMAAVYGDIAASYAFKRHCGLFVSRELEQVLLTIGRKAIQSSHYPSQSNSLHETPRKILHVATSVKSIGGHSTMIWRWIQQDTERSHSFVLTRQAADEVPKMFKDAVINSHGKIYVLNETIDSSFVSWAKRLRQIAASADMVVLHISIDDIIPTIAFANKEQSPPIIFVNQGDEVFWVGAGISDVVANLRQSGMRLSIERRGIEAERNTLLPITLNPIHRTLSRTEAKRQLGLAEDSIVLFSIGRRDKYMTMDGMDEISFADVYVPLLERYNRAVLIVIGPDQSEDWSAAIQRTQGRIRIFGEREDNAVYFQAADIYVDSYPNPSNTALLEAGSYGLPLVSYSPYSVLSDMLAASAPGLEDHMVLTRDLVEHTAVLSRLVDDEEFRLSLGEATRRYITEIHTGRNWQRSLEDVYLRAATVPQVTVTSTLKDEKFVDGLNFFVVKRFYQLFSQEVDLDELIRTRAWLMPFKQRLRLWIKLLKKRDLGHRGGIGILLPQWIYLRLQKLYLRLQNPIKTSSNF